MGAFTHYPRNPFARKFTSPPEHHFATSNGKKNHALILGYRHNLLNPSVAFSIPDKTQGVIFTESLIYLSRSYGRTCPSCLEIHRVSTLPVSPHSLRLGGNSAPLHIVDSGAAAHSIKLPPMSEGICRYKNYIVILFESGATKYQRGGLGPVDRLAFYTIDVQ